MTITVKRKDLPIIVPQSIQIGDDWVGTTFRHKNPDGTPIDLSGTVVSGRLKLQNGTILDFPLAMDAADGSYYPTLDRTVTAGLTGKTARYDIDLVDSLGRKTHYWAGPVTIKETLPPAEG